MNNPLRIVQTLDRHLADIRFLLQQEPLTSEQLRAACQRARVPDVPEIQDLFRAGQPKVLALTESIS